MLEDISWVIAHCSSLSNLVPIAVGFFYFKKNSRIQLMLFYLVLFSGFADLVGYISGFFFDNNQFLFHFFALIQFGFFLWIYQVALKSIFKKTIFYFIFFILFIIAILEAFFLGNLKGFNGVTAALAGIFIIFLALSFFYKTLKELKIKHLEKEPLFWISTGTLLYFSSSLLIFLFRSLDNLSLTVQFIIWDFHNIFNILMNVFFGIALWIRTDG